MSSPRRLPWTHAPLRAGRWPLLAEAAHYLRTVLRLSAGSQVELFDGAGQIALATLDDGEPPQLQIGTVRAADTVTAPLTLAVAAPKGERADWLAEKLGELGVTTITWLLCDRSIVQPVAGSARMQRWHRLLTAGARQSGQARVPEMQGPLTLPAWLAQPAPPRRLVAQPGGQPMLSLLAGEAAATAILIGPEGGFSPNELQQLEAAGYSAVGLGSAILRVETAAVAAAALYVATSFSEVAAPCPRHTFNAPTAACKTSLSPPIAAAASDL